MYSVWSNLNYIFTTQIDDSFQGELFFISEPHSYAVYHQYSPFHGSKIDCTDLIDDKVPCSFFIILFKQI